MSEREQAAEHAADMADRLFGELIGPGHWPEEDEALRAVVDKRFSEGFAAYAKAMTLNPDAAEYPWNLASRLARLGLNDLALPFLIRATKVAGATNDSELGGPDALLLLAEVALNAGQPSVALAALARAAAEGLPDTEAVALADRLRREAVAAMDQQSLVNVLDARAHARGRLRISHGVSTAPASTPRRPSASPTKPGVRVTRGNLQ